MRILILGAGGTGGYFGGRLAQAGIDAEGRILVTGSFTTWNGIAAPGVARLVVDRPEVGFATLSATVDENGGPLGVEIVRYGNTDEPASVRVTTTAGTAGPVRKTSTRSSMETAARAQEPALRSASGSAWARKRTVRPAMGRL